jgi:hypothetical protein
MTVRKINTDNYEMGKIQDNLSSAIDSLTKTYPLLNGVFVKAAIGTADTIVNHGLQRPVVGFLITRRDGSPNVYESSTTNNRPSDCMILKASTAVNVTIYFF